jgi:E3 ubiquitin-protein ligase HERC3
MYVYMCMYVQVSVGVGRTAVQVVAGTWNTCVLLDDGTVKCFGNGAYGTNGAGATADRGDTPATMPDQLAAIK